MSIMEYSAWLGLVKKGWGRIPKIPRIELISPELGLSIKFQIVEATTMLMATGIYITVLANLTNFRFLFSITAVAIARITCTGIIIRLNFKVTQIEFRKLGSVNSRL
jgi:hypothetical protein